MESHCQIMYNENIIVGRGVIWHRNCIFVGENRHDVVNRNDIDYICSER